LPAELLMPRVSPAMQEATVVGWLKKEGDPIRKDEIVVTIESEKASQDVEALTDGVLYKIVAQVGEVVPVNTPLAIIRLPQDTVADLRPYDSSSPAPDNRSDDQPVAATAPSNANGVIKSSPLARKLAESRGIDLAAIPSGSGPGGRIVEQDVLAFCEAMASKSEIEKPVVRKFEDSCTAITAPEDKRIPLSSIRQRTIARLRQSKDNTIPVTSVTEMDLTDLVALYRQVKPVWQTAQHTSVTLNAFFVKAVALALRRYEILNSTFAESEIVVKNSINIGLATYINDGLYVPVIRSADTLSVLTIANVISDFVQKIEQKSLLPEDMADGTFTITNVGPFDVLFSTPIIFYPQVAILGIGKLCERPVFVGEQIVKRQLCHFSLTYDHRVVDGVPAASFRKALKELLEQPMSLLS
jgi:pyruvate dehydrogenase E2 component (dihydrolipoamide acetyltransferase)